MRLSVLRAAVSTRCLLLRRRRRLLLSAEVLRGSLLLLRLLLYSWATTAKINGHSVWLRIRLLLLLIHWNAL